MFSNRIMVVATMILLMVTGIAGAQDNLPVAERVGKLVGQLSDDNIDVREKATEELIAMGEPAKGALSAAARSNDPEVKHRADLILRVVEIKGKINFSEKLLAWYPEIYRELSENFTIRGRYDVFLKLTVFDSEKEQRAVEMENSDIGEVVKLLAADGYKGLSAEEKICVAEVCGGTYRYSNEVDHSTSSSAWIVKGVAGDIVPLLKDQDERVRGSAAYALGKMEAKDIVSLLKDENANVRMSAADALGKLKAREYAKDIVPLLKDQSADVRGSAAYAIVKLDAKEYANDIVPLLKDENEDVRRKSACALGKLKAREYAKDIVPLLKDQSADVRGSAAYAIVKLDAKEYANDIVPLLKDADMGVRTRVIYGLGEMRAIEYAKDIVPILKDEDWLARFRAACALGTMGAKEYAKEVAPLLKDQDERVRGSAAYALGKMGAKEYSKDIVPLLKEISKAHIGARTALKELGMSEEEIRKAEE